ncbi:zinc finger Ran-binding domain-containing protein 2-like isoform X2 [Dysidea avara]|uniref:zinc finger Ran-binding domain-containing protein 2-like isoform X2 n=1 Tax=Dysidea avara TaxID=196820 RepID=UPI0033278D35
MRETGYALIKIVETSTSRGGHVVTDVGKVLIVCRLFASALFACCSRDAEKGKVDIFKKTGSEIGKSAAAKSGGLFSAEDWQCSKCGNVNWARRNTCNVCNEPKFGKVEARTGFGGGYNERDEIVEYKDRNDSDGELDEFGRKKKKLRTSTNKQPSEDDEEEEDDSDEDVSKYDLLGSDDESDEKRKSRSRSTSPDRHHGRHNRQHQSRSPEYNRHRSRSPRR